MDCRYDNCERGKGALCCKDCRSKDLCPDACEDEDGFCLGSEEAILRTVFSIAKNQAIDFIDEYIYRHQNIDIEKIKSACLKGFAEAELHEFIEEEGNHE